MTASNQKSSRVRAETRARREAGTAREAAEVPLTTGNLGELTSTAMSAVREFHVSQCAGWSAGARSHDEGAEPRPRPFVIHPPGPVTAMGRACRRSRQRGYPRWPARI